MGKFSEIILKEREGVQVRSLLVPNFADCKIFYTMNYIEFTSRVKIKSVCNVL